MITNEVDEFKALLKDLGATDEQIVPVLEAFAANPKWQTAHLVDLQKLVNSIHARMMEQSVRVLIADANKLRLTPPYLLAKLKLALNDFNAKTYSWRKV